MEYELINKISTKRRVWRRKSTDEKNNGTDYSLLNYKNGQLAAMVRKNIEIDQQLMRIKPVVKMRKKPKEFVITFMRRKSIWSLVAAMEKLLNAKECTKEMNEGIWLDYDKGRI
ncbi:MAG: hypothetical protein EZS28_033522 [Streblomastix strix]|uniref:Uncharacterized protein n=1 Tax=Streblomastix strix TaxID=222440 RepID=A0A5J4ULG6_9EUKA|nr:MAG: hypothetical protein EZS28_033522 [Streblomastix strix]